MSDIIDKYLNEGIIDKIQKKILNIAREYKKIKVNKEIEMQLLKMNDLIDFLERDIQKNKKKDIIKWAINLKTF